jgi:Electron transfer flavoprotein domain
MGNSWHLPKNCYSYFKYYITVKKYSQKQFNLAHFHFLWWIARIMLISLSRSFLNHHPSKYAYALARCASTLVIAEPLSEGCLSPATCSTVTAASQLGGEDISLLVVNATLPSKIPKGISRIYHVNCEDRLTETVAAAVEATVGSKGSEKWGHIVAPSSKFGSTVVPRAAALLSLSPVTDVTQIIDPGTYCLIESKPRIVLLNKFLLMI